MAKPWEAFPVENPNQAPEPWKEFPIESEGRPWEQFPVDSTLPPESPQLSDKSQRFAQSTVENAADTVAGLNRANQAVLSGVDDVFNKVVLTAADAGLTDFAVFLRNKQDQFRSAAKTGGMRGESLAQFMQEAAQGYQPDPARDKEFLSKVAQGAGSLPAIIAGGVIPGAQVVTGGAMMGEQGYQEAIAAAPEEQTAAQKERTAMRAFALNAGTTAASEALLGVPALLRSVAAAKEPAKDAVELIGRALWQGVKGVFREGAQEGIEQVGQNLIAKELYDPNRPVDQGVIDSILVGGVIGGPFSAAVEAGNEALKRTAAQVGPATEQAVSSSMDQPATETIDSRGLNEPTVKEPLAVAQTDLESALASEDLDAAESLLLNPNEAFQTPSDLLAAIALDEQPTQTEQIGETPVQSEVLPTDGANPETVVNAEPGPGIETVAEAGAVGPLFVSNNEGHAPIIDQWTPALNQSGITQDRVTLNPSSPNPMRVNWDTEGNPLLEINPEATARLAPEALEAVLHEELVHTEHINSIRGSWDQATGTFDQHLKSEMGKVVAEGRALGLNVEASKIYGDPTFQEGFEVVRQLVQGRKAGTVTEAQVNPQNAPTIWKLLNDLLGKFKTLLANNPNSTIAEYVKNIEIALYGESDLQTAATPTEANPNAVSVTRANRSNAPPPVSTNFLQPAGAAPIQPEAPTSYVEYQGKQFPVYSAEKIKKSKGAFGDNYFYAPSTQSIWSNSADNFLAQFPSTPEGIRQARNLINDPSSPMDEATKNYVRAQSQVSLIEMTKGPNLIDRVQAVSLLDSIGAEQLQSGTSEAQALASRAGSNKLLQPFAGYLAGRDVLVQRQAKEIAPRFAENVEVIVRGHAEEAGRLANAEIVGQIEDSQSGIRKYLDRILGSNLARIFNQIAQSVSSIFPGASPSRVLNQINREEGISWKDIFANMPVGAQRERQAYLTKRLQDHPDFGQLTQNDQEKLNKAIQLVWAKERQRIFKGNLNREGALGEKTKADREKVIAEAPKLLQYLNTGNLTASDFRDILASRYGIAQLNGESMNKLRDLAQKAYDAPEGLQRNKLMDQIAREIFNVQGVRPFDILKNVWFAGVLSSPRTWIDIMTGGVTIGAYNNMIQAFDAGLMARDPKRGFRILSAFWSNIGEAFANAQDIMKTGDYSRLSEADRHFNAVLDGRSTPEMLETLKANPKNFGQWLAGQAAYVRRVMTAMDYLTQLPTREANILYVSSLVDPETYAAAEAKYNKEASEKASQQAMDELGPKAKKVDVMARTREILELSIDQDVKDRATEMARIAALNQDPRGIGGMIQNVIAQLPFAFRGPLGLAFSRPLINFVQISANATPGLGILNYYRAHPVFTQWVDGVFPGAKSGKRSETAEWLAPNLPPEQTRIMVYYQLLSLGALATFAAARFGLEDKDRNWEISGSWYGLTPQQKNSLRDIGEKPLSIGFGPKENRRWITFAKFSPLAVPLATLGNLSDKQRFRPSDWTQEPIMTKMMDGFAGGVYFFKDASMIRVLSDLTGQSVASQNDFESLSKTTTQAASSFASGFIPFNSLLRDVDAWTDDNLYKPESGLDYWLTNVPFARRSVGSGPTVNALGEPVSISRSPWSRISSEQKEDPISIFLDKQAMKGVFATVPNSPEVYDPKTQSKVSLKTLSPALLYEYQMESGKAFKKLLQPNMEAIDKLPADAAKEFMDRLRQAANKQAKGKIQAKIPK